MSYIRFNWDLSYVIGKSRDYIWSGGGDHLEDYGGLSNLGIVEMLCETIDESYKDDEMFARYLKEKLARKLGVFLREKKLEWKIDNTDLHRKILLGHCAHCIKKKVKNEFCKECKIKLMNKIKDEPKEIQERYYKSYGWK